MPTKGNKAPTITAGNEPAKIYAPIAGKPSQIFGQYGEDRGDHIHAGIDVGTSTGTPCIAPVDGKITMVMASGFGEEGGMIHFEFQQDLGPIKKGDVIGWGHAIGAKVSQGQTVKAGQYIGESDYFQAPHVHFIFQSPGVSGEPDGTSDPNGAYTFLRTEGKDTSGFKGNEGEEGPGASSEAGGASAAEVESVSKAAALDTFINLPTIQIAAESLALKGERSLMNDKPLLPFIEQLCQGSLRQFMSMPNGNFYAFIPDYFGGLTKRTAYWSIDDIEILDGKIELSDDALATHVYVVGDSATIDGSIDLLEKMQTAGVVTVFNAFMANFITGSDVPTSKSQKESRQYQHKIEKLPTLANKGQALAFLEKYGARPFYQAAPMIRSHYFEMFLAYQLFCLLWSKQFVTTFEFTFMPELFPGGLIRLENHGLQLYVDEVRHEGDYENGFRTLANLSAPTALRGGNRAVHEGMVRSAVLTPAAVKEPGDIQSHEPKHKSN